MALDDRRGRLPTFLVIGAGKSGTSSLAAYLSQCPGVFMARPKEPNFFSLGWHKGLGWYEDRFEGAAGAIAIGEASTTYSVAPSIPHVAQRIAATLPEARFVYSIRNPVERIRSHYQMNVGRLRERRSLREVLVADPGYLDASRYAYQLDEYLRLFDRDRILVISAEQLNAKRAATVGHVLSFIGAPGAASTVRLDEELNRGADVRRTGPVVETAAAVLRRAGVQRLLSKPTKQRFRRRLGHPVQVHVPPDVEREIWDVLAPDLARLREIVGPEFHLWDRA